MNTDPNTKTCAKCKTVMEHDDAWCPECGSPAPLVAARSSFSMATDAPACPTCGEPAESGDAWCASCGSHLPPQNTHNSVPATPATSPTSTEAFSARSVLAPIGNSTEVSPDPSIATTSMLHASVDAGDNSRNQPHAPISAQAQSALGSNQEKPPFAEAGVDGKVAAAREALNAAGAEAVYTASETRAGKSVKNHWLGWAVLAFVVIVGIFSISAAKRSGERKIEALRAVAAVPATPRPPTEAEMKQAAIDARWREAADYNARLEARQRAEAEAQQRSAEALERALTRVNNEMNSSVPQTQPDMSAMQRQQDQQMQELKKQQEKAQRYAEENRLVVWRCYNCNQELTRPANDPPTGRDGGECINRRSGIKYLDHNYEQKR